MLSGVIYAGEFCTTCRSLKEMPNVCLFYLVFAVFPVAMNTFFFFFLMIKEQCLI